MPRTELAIVEAAVAALDEGVMVLDGDGRVVALNRAAVAMSARAPDELLGVRAGEPPLAFALEDGSEVDDDTSPVLAVMRTGRAVRDRLLRVPAGDGGQRRVRASFHPLVRGADEPPWGVVVAFRDVSGPEELRRFSGQLGAMLSDDITLAYARSTGGRLLLTSARLRALAGEDGERLPDAWEARDRAVLRDGRTTLTDEELGSERFLMIRFPLLDEGGDPYATGAVAAEFTARARDVERLEHDALHDALTGLANRRLLRQHLDLAMARARRQGTSLAVLFLDVDGLKAINDEHGHPAGDEVLRQLADRLGATVRETDVLARPAHDDALVARHGGDEFLLVLADVPDPDLAIAAVTARLTKRLAEPFIVGGGTPLHVRASIGASVYPRDGADADTLVRRADEAMYRMKRSGS